MVCFLFTIRLNRYSIMTQLITHTAVSVTALNPNTYVLTARAGRSDMMTYRIILDVLISVTR